MGIGRLPSNQAWRPKGPGLVSPTTSRAGRCLRQWTRSPARARHTPNLVQAYSFTSIPILAALKAAHARGVDCRGDRRQDLGPRQQVGLPLLRGDLSHQCRYPGLGRHARRHLRDAELAARHRDNWERRREASVSYTGPLKPPEALE